MYFCSVQVNTNDMNLQKNITQLYCFILLFTLSCSSDDDSATASNGCSELDNYGEMIIEAPDFEPYVYNNFKYSYIDREGVDNQGNSVYQFIYSNYDIENDTIVDEGYFLKFRIKTPDDLPDGTFSLSDPDKTISDVETFYDYSTGGGVGFVDVSRMTLTFSNFNNCLNHHVAIYFIDDDFFPGTIGNGQFDGTPKLYTIE